MPNIHVNDISLYFELHGPVDAPVLVLNNGLIMNAATSWVFQTKPLSQDFRILQYDCRGQGQSDHPDQAYTMELHADDLYKLLEKLGETSAHIAGISYGGEVAQAFALKYPKKVRSLILIDTVSEVNTELRLVGLSWIDALRSKDPIKFFNATIPWNFSARFIRDNPLLLEDAKKRYAQLDFPSVIRLIEAFLEVEFTNRLKEIEAPTCIVVGEKDILKGVEYAYILHSQIPNSEYHIIPEAGHATCWENPEVFNHHIFVFLVK